jgi:hypothetical protein
MANVSAQDFFGSSAPQPVANSQSSVSADSFFGSSAPVLASNTPLATSATPQKSGGFLSSIGDQFKSGIGQIKQGFKNLTSGQSSPLQGAESGLGIESGLVSAVTAPLAPIFSPISKGINALASGYTGANGQHVGGIGDIPLVQKLANSKAGAVISRVAGDLANAGNVAGAIAGVGKAPKVGSSIADTASSTIDTAKQGLQDKYINQAKQDFIAPTKTNTAGFNKATDILSNAAKTGHDIPQTLVDNGVTLAKIVENGKYNTSDIADMLRQDTGKLSHDLLRPSLEQANYSTQRVPVSDIVESAKQQIQKDSTILGEQKDTLASKLDAVESALNKQYPDGLSLTDLHDEKILRGANAKLSPIGDISTNLEAMKNRQLSSTLKSLVEEKAPSNVPVKEFNAELHKRYQAADYLDALDTKKVPTSIAQKAAQTVAKVIGATIGEKATGGLLGGVGGYHLGGLLERYVQNMPDPIKNYFLDNLKQKNPTAFEQVKNALSENDLKNASMAKLPAPKPVDPSQVAIPMGARYSPDVNKVQISTGKLPLGMGRVETPQARLLAPSENTPNVSNNVPINLPKSITEVNNGTNDLTNAKIRNPMDRRILLKGKKSK